MLNSSVNNCANLAIHTLANTGLADLSAACERATPNSAPSILVFDIIFFIHYF